MKKPSKSTIRNKADRLLQEYIRLKYEGELCWHCGEEFMSVGHHFIYVAQANATRYFIPNIIPLCRDCHLYAHRWQNLFAAKITAKLGQDWLTDLEATRKQGAKFTLEWAKTNHDILQKMLEELKC